MKIASGSSNKARDIMETDCDGIVYQLPEVIRIEPASLCNLKCTHCPTGLLMTENRGTMSPETFENVMRELKVLEPRVVVLYHGGEPFINKNILKMIKQIKSIDGVFVKTVTNGMLVKESMLRELVQSGLDSIEFSIDGNSPEENNAIRQGGDYHAISSIIKKLIDIKNELGSETPEIFIANCQIPTNPDLEKGQPGIPKYIKEDFYKYESDIQFKTCWAIYWPGMPIETSKYRLSPKNDNTLNYCEHPIELITIRHNGDIVPCCYDTTSAYVIGNIGEESIKELWNNEKYRTLRKSIYYKNYLPLCENCNVIGAERLIIKR